MEALGLLPHSQGDYPTIPNATDREFRRLHLLEARLVGPPANSLEALMCASDSSPASRASRDSVSQIGFQQIGFQQPSFPVSTPPSRSSQGLTDHVNLRLQGRDAIQPRNLQRRDSNGGQIFDDGAVDDHRPAAAKRPLNAESASVSVLEPPPPPAPLPERGASSSGPTKVPASRPAKRPRAVSPVPPAASATGSDGKAGAAGRRAHGAGKGVGDSTMDGVLQENNLSQPGRAFSPDAAAGKGTRSKVTKPIQAYFSKNSSTSKDGVADEGGQAGAPDGEDSHWAQEASLLREQLAAAQAKLEAQRQDHDDHAAALRAELKRKHDELAGLQAERLEAEERTLALLARLLREAARREAEECRRRLAVDSVELGKVVMGRAGPHSGMQEHWEEGRAWEVLSRQETSLGERKTSLEQRRKVATASLKSAAAGTPEELEAVQEQEAVKVHLAQLRRDEASLADRRRDLELRKMTHMQDMKRAAMEDRSTFRNMPILKGIAGGDSAAGSRPYLLLQLVGKGGFSEVWRAFDLRGSQEVAVKIHQLNNQWSEAKKHSYIHHATREYKIHKTMSHPRIVRLLDVFEIDSNTFATVLELCKGTDLERHLRHHRQLPEKDARVILLQIMCGLQYLNTTEGTGRDKRPAIIHYDLKPGNILFDEAEDVKITDFGLSKILDNTTECTSMELTSQGAGTYWYLPPECFMMGSTPPRISSKVDVWSVGVIYYQMLYGSRPFGEGKSQDAILAENTMLRATRVEFPDKPAVSEDGKDFIKSCLRHSQADRPDVLTLCGHSYLRGHKK